MKRLAIIFSLVFLLPFTAHAAEKFINVYAWTSELPDFAIRLFEKETGIKVNMSTYENNEIMYAKLRATNRPTYDIVMPSGYFVDRMLHQNMIEKLDLSKLPNKKNLNPRFVHPDYDPQTEFSIPFTWGVTGMFYNSDYFPDHVPKKWADLWDNKYHNKLMILDDTREVFSMALLALGYSANDRNPEHIKEAFLKLQKLMPNIKVFSSDTVVSIMIDEDATVGMAWNGDSLKASEENGKIHFVFPEEGFIIWVDNLCIPKNAPHLEYAYAFINFMLRPDIAKEIAIYTNYSTANLAAQRLLPANLRNNATIYPPDDILKRGKFQIDLGEETLGLYEKYWEELKISG